MRIGPLWIFIPTFLYTIWISHYFGRNFFPKSEAELIADGLALIIYSLGVLCYCVENKK
jgi:hypothetical protein